ncbi:hypothetical protein I0C86_38120, partial [Plantactinospora sp. S1510]|nr:hypothetical protein [Plantactinospora alkalitolerans]
MSAREAPEESRSKPLLTVLFWVGVGLAPLAALLLLLGQGNGPLRIAAVLAVLAVVLIGLSITLRGNAEGIQLDLEETLLEEIDELRGELRTDIATAARATHKAFGEKLELVQGNVEALRGQLDAVRASVDSPRAVAAAPTAPPASSAVAGAAVAGAAVAGAAVAGAAVGGAAVGATGAAGRGQHEAPGQAGWAPKEAPSAGWAPAAAA